MAAGAPTPCLDPDEILAFIGGSEAPLAQRVQRHVDACEECRALLSEAVRTCASLLTTTPRTTGDVSEPTDAPERLGRFALEERVGSGASGVVFRAHDAQLERAVAVKLLRADADPGMSAEEAEARFLREARAMARVNHPNVVVVHEVGSVDGRVYVAMEYVQGSTLRRWLARERPSLTRLMDVFMQAGRGLASAHAAGLVHRDFKPENVLVGDDGRVRVTDFGLASVRARELPGPSSRALSVMDLDTPLTLSGCVMGTPRYMAPEQHRAELADARADQFAFCATLYEALTGTPAYPGSTYEELARNVLAGAVRVPAPGEMPESVWAVLERGLERERDARFADLESLLAALERAVQCANSGENAPLDGGAPAGPSTSRSQGQDSGAGAARAQTSSGLGPEQGKLRRGVLALLSLAGIALVLLSARFGREPEVRAEQRAPSALQSTASGSTGPAALDRKLTAEPVLPAPETPLSAGAVVSSEPPLPPPAARHRAAKLGVPARQQVAPAAHGAAHDKRVDAIPAANPATDARAAQSAEPAPMPTATGAPASSTHHRGPRMDLEEF